MATQFSTLDASGSTFVIQPGSPFQTFWENDGEGKQPNVVSHAWNALDLWGAPELARWCITTATVPDPLPDEVPMYRVRIVLAQQGLTAGVNTYIAGLSGAQQIVAQELWANAPSLVVAGDFAMAAKAALGLTDAQYASLIQAAMDLAL